VLKWPSAKEVEAAVRLWAGRIGTADDNILRIGIFGSYATGRWGVGSDLDIVVVLRTSHLAFEKRGLEFDALELPVHADVLVYTESEWKSGLTASRFRKSLADQAVWVYEREGE
jgi:predicted nucleotidyltransferase